jgi:hypothetical protein
VATTRAPSKHDVYAVVRLDSFRNFTPRPEHVTIPKVVQRLVDAESEVRHLNMTAPTGTVYFIQRTTVVPKNESVVAARSPAAATREFPLLPRSRGGPAEKNGGQKKEKKR